MASTSEAEVGGIFQNIKTAVPLLINVNELGFLPLPTPIKTYNSSDKVIFAVTFIQKIKGNEYEIVLDEGPG